MLEIPLNTALPAALASLPRVFLTPVIPGYVGENGNVHLPLMMDGACVDIGIHIEDDRALTEWANSNKSFFASENKLYDLYRCKEAYESVVQPDWLKAAAKRIGDTIDAYAKTVGTGSRILPTVTRLRNRWLGMQPLLSALLYIKLPIQPPTRVLTPQDLALYGPPVEKGNLRDTIDLLETLTHVDDLILEGMTDRIVIEDDEDQSTRELHDVFKNHADPYIEVYDALGRPIRFEKSLVRPVCTYALDDERQINPLSTGAAMVHDAYDAFQAEMLSRNIMVSGAYLMAHFRIEDKEAADLLRRLGPHVDKNPDLLTDDERSIVASHLRTTGRGQGRETENYALLIAKVLRKIARIA